MIQQLFVINRRQACATGSNLSDIVFVGMKTVRNGNAKATTLLQEFKRQPVCDVHFFHSEVFPHVLGEEAMSLVHPKQGLPVVTLSDIQSILIGTNPSLIHRLASA